MLPTLVEQYRRWFDYEKDTHRRVLASFETVPEEGLRSQPFQKALNSLAHIVAARRMWLHRFEPSSFDRPANLFPTDATLICKLCVEEERNIDPSVIDRL